MKIVDQTTTETIKLTRIEFLDFAKFHQLQELLYNKGYKCGTSMSVGEWKAYDKGPIYIIELTDEGGNHDDMFEVVEKFKNL